MGLKTSSGSDFSGMCISLIAKRGEQLVYDAMPKDASPDDFINLKSLFNATALAGPHSEKRLEYYQVLLQYKISVIEIDDENLELDEVIEIFERLNLGGKNKVPALLIFPLNVFSAEKLLTHSLVAVTVPSATKSAIETQGRVW